MLCRRSLFIFCSSLLFSLNVVSFEESEPQEQRGLIANLIIKSQQPAFWFARWKHYPEMQPKSVKLGSEEYSYLVRKGERQAIVILLHGILSRKDHFMSLVHHWVKMSKPLPTIIAVDLLGHGNHHYPADYDFSIENFTRHSARFIRYIQTNNPDSPMVIIGHSLGGGVAALLKPLEGINASATILISPAGVGTTNTTDFKARIEAEKGLPFDFGSQDVCELLEAPFEKHGVVVSKLLRSACFLYSYLDCPYETWAKNKMFAQLAKSEHALLIQKSDREHLDEYVGQPVYLIWTRSDQMFDRSRYTPIGEYIVQKNIGQIIELEGSHVWPLEHPDEAAKVLDPLIDQALPPVLDNESSANPVLPFWLTAVLWRFLPSSN